MSKKEKLAGKLLLQDNIVCFKLMKHLTSMMIFFKDKIKPQMIIVAMVYGVYAICHMYIFHVLKTGCSYGNELRELQYLVNYTFMIINLFI